jgi:hypothetical protein
MDFRKMVFFIFFLSIAISFSTAIPTNQQALIAVECNARLKTPRSGTSSVYDGSDTVYILGGWYYNNDLIPYADIHAYNISSDTIRVIGQLPRTAWNGIIHFNR